MYGSVIPILLLIARSKLVPDFALTIHGLHLIVTSLYTHEIPLTLFWWLVQIGSAALMTGVGMWACQWRELQPISFGGNSSKGKERAGNGHPVEPGAAEEGEGHGMGISRGRGRDGAGSYEMVGMDPGEGA